MFDNKSFDFELHPSDHKSRSWVEPAKLFAYLFSLLKVETFPWANLHISVNYPGKMITLGLSLNGEVLLYKL